MKRIVLTVFIVLTSPSAYADTVWCNPANTGSEDGLTKATGYNTLWDATRYRVAGDTIIIANGDWSSRDIYMNMNMDMNSDWPLDRPISGTGPDNYTSIIAETDWGVRLPTLSYDNARHYMRFQGIIFHNFYINGWTNSKFIRCGFFKDKVTSNDACASLYQCSNILMEECIAWGGGRYKFLEYQGDYNVFRRCVARHDWYIADNEEQESNFRGYGSNSCVWQNCISIDSDREQYQNLNCKEDADFWVGDQSGAGGNIIEGCIVLKGMYQAYYFAGQEGGSQTVVLKDSVAIGPAIAGILSLTGASTWGEITATYTNLFLSGYNTGYHHLVSHNKDTGSLTVNSSLFKDSGAVNAGTFDYNYYYNVGSYSYGAHSVNADPEQNGLLYPVRIEAGSALATAGEGGGVCGPTILKKIGTSGTLYGETGWNTVTDDDLWPYPNEDTIKTLMSTTVADVSGEYGFCTGTSIDGSAQTLTKYVWEYLGNQIPADIYGSGTSAIPNRVGAGTANRLQSGTSITIGAE